MNVIDGMNVEWAPMKREVGGANEINLNFKLKLKFIEFVDAAASLPLILIFVSASLHLNKINLHSLAPLTVTWKRYYNSNCKRYFVSY